MATTSIFSSKKNKKTLDRSVDSLRNIYTIIIALAIGNAINKLFISNSTTFFDTIFIKNIPVLLAFFLTVVPFFHGMNRHLDECYITKDSKAQGFLLFDFFAFSLEAIIFVVFANRYMNGLEGYIILGILLSFDIFWCIISHFVHFNVLKKQTFKWVIINAIVLLIGILIYYLKTEQNLNLIFCILAILRTTLDYVFCWEYYFPNN